MSEITPFRLNVQASEIDAKGDQEFFVEKQRLVNKASANIRNEYGNRDKAVEVEQKMCVVPGASAGKADWVVCDV